jgi:hypothetical protein
MDAARTVERSDCPARTRDTRRHLAGAIVRVRQAIVAPGSTMVRLAKWAAAQMPLSTLDNASVPATVTVEPPFGLPVKMPW